MGFYFSFYATVNRATSFGSVIGNRLGLAVANSVNTLATYTVLINQNFTNGVGTTLGQFLVVSVSTNGVSVTFNSRGGCSLLLP